MWFFGDGFDVYDGSKTNNSDLFAGGYWEVAVDGFGNIQWNGGLATGRYVASKALRVENAVGTYIQKTSGNNHGIHHISMNVLYPTAMNVSYTGMFVSLRDGVSSQVTALFTGDGAIEFYSGDLTGTLIARYENAIGYYNTWYNFEIEFVIHDVSGSISVRKEGNTVPDFTETGLNTRGGSAHNYANSVRIGPSQNYTRSTYLDDFLWRSDSSAVTWAGLVRCETRRADSDASVAWTPNIAGTNASAVGEPTEDGLTTYVSSSTVGDADWYGLAPASFTPTAVLGVVTRGLFAKSDSGSRIATVRLKSGSTTVAAPAPSSLAVTWAWVWRVDLINPAGGSWTAAAVDAIQIGPIVTA